MRSNLNKFSSTIRSSRFTHSSFSTKLLLLLRTFSKWPGNPYSLLVLSKSDMQEVHAQSAKYTLYKRFGGYAFWIKLMLTLAWPIRLSVLSLKAISRFGDIVQAKLHLSKRKQFLVLYWLGIRFGIAPIDAYRFQLLVPSNQAHVRNYLYTHEANGLFFRLNKNKIAPEIDDKRLFADLGTKANIAVPATLAYSIQGRIVQTTDQWPSGDLFSKPCVGSRGEGCIWWRSGPSGTYYRKDGRQISRSQLLNLLCFIYQDRDWLIQPALYNHSAIEDLGNGSLVCARLITACLPNHASELILGILKIPINNSHINNHGIGSAIDFSTGTIGKGYSYRPFEQPYEHHPNTHAPICGRLIPNWSSTMNLAVSAHRLFPDTVFIAWDIGITCDGPVLLEANWCWDTVMPQLIANKPLGHTKWIEYCHIHLANITTQ